MDRSNNRFQELEAELDEVENEHPTWRSQKGWQMKKLLLTLSLLSSLAFAQTSTIKGTIKDLRGLVVTSRKVTFTLPPSSDVTMSRLARFTPHDGGSLIGNFGSPGFLVAAAQSLNTVPVADQQSGSDACAKILAGWKPRTGGPEDARGFPFGPQSCSANPLPTGVPGALILGNTQFNTTASWVLSQNQSIRGTGFGSVNEGATFIQAVPGFPSHTPVLQTNDGGAASRVEDIGIGCNGQKGAIGAYIPDSEEGTVWKHLNIRDCPGIGFSIGDGTPGHGQNGGQFEDIYVASGSSAILASTVGVLVNVKSTAFRGINGLTVAFSGAASTPTNCVILRAPGVYQNIHLENCVNGINVEGFNVILLNVNCANTVTDCVHVTSGSALVCAVTGTPTNLVNNALDTITIPASVFGNSLSCYQIQGRGKAQGLPLWTDFGFVEGTAPTSIGFAGVDSCYGDSTLHMTKCSYSHQRFLPSPQTGNTSGTHSDSGLYQTASATGCTTASSIGGLCATATTVTWPVAFADSNYKISCQGTGAITNFPIMGSVTSRNATTATVQTMALTAAAASFATIECIAVHN